jgi:hypothetical protein
MLTLRRKPVRFLIIGVGLLLGVGLFVVWPRRFEPHATLTMLGYDWTNLTTYTVLNRATDSAASNPEIWLDSRPPTDPRDRYVTNAQTLVVRVRLTNTGRQPIAFYAYGNWPVIYCRIKKGDQWLNLREIRFSGGAIMLRVGESIDEIVWLPPDVGAFDGHLCGGKPSLGMKTSYTVDPTHFPDPVLWVLEQTFRFLPGTSTDTVFSSEAFTICQSESPAVQVRELHVK